MCNYIYVRCPEYVSFLFPFVLTSPQQKELSCQHHYYLVESWCSKYIETERRCPPTIVSKQYWFVYMSFQPWWSIADARFHKGEMTFAVCPPDEKKIAPLTSTPQLLAVNANNRVTIPGRNLFNDQRQRHPVIINTTCQLDEISTLIQPWRPCLSQLPFQIPFSWTGTISRSGCINFWKVAPCAIKIVCIQYSFAARLIAKLLVSTLLPKSCRISPQSHRWHKRNVFIIT
jgi:hypothetical protein